MPNIKSAKKKLRQDRKRTIRNLRYKRMYKSALKNVRKAKNLKEAREWLAKAYSWLDKAAKRHVIHANKAARLKSRITKFFLKKYSHAQEVSD